MGDILLRGTKVVIPEKLPEIILVLTHERNSGISVLKGRLRSKFDEFVWIKMQNNISRRAKVVL